VRKLARSHGLDLAALAGTGPDGLIVRRDVEAAIAASTAPTTAPTTVASAPRATGTPAPACRSARACR
jgi:pyruvate dehydrogenase E2 component (dihydrolipoamide acetyltransferase)